MRVEFLTRCTEDDLRAVLATQQRRVAVARKNLAEREARIASFPAMLRRAKAAGAPAHHLRATRQLRQPACRDGPRGRRIERRAALIIDAAEYLADFSPERARSAMTLADTIAQQLAARISMRRSTGSPSCAGCARPSSTRSRPRSRPCRRAKNSAFRANATGANQISRGTPGEAACQRYRAQIQPGREGRAAAARSHGGASPSGASPARKGGR